MPLRLVPIALALLLALTGASTGCMRASEEEAAERAERARREAQLREGATRRYELHELAAEPARRLSLERRGPTVVLDGPSNHTLARVSIRRDAGHVVVREGGGRIVAQTRALADGTGIELVERDRNGTLGRPLATLRPSATLAAGSLEVSGADAQPLAALVLGTDGSVVVTEPQGAARAPRFVVRPQPDGSLEVSAPGANDALALTHRLEARSGLTAEALALLVLEPLPYTTRLGLAVHLAELGTARSPLPSDH